MRGSEGRDYNRDATMHLKFRRIDSKVFFIFFIGNSLKYKDVKVCFIYILQLLCSLNTAKMLFSVGKISLISVKLNFTLRIIVVKYETEKCPLFICNKVFSNILCSFLVTRLLYMRFFI